MAKQTSSPRQAQPPPRLTWRGHARPGGKPASRHRLSRALYRPGIHHALPDHRPARFRAPGDRLRARKWLVESKSLKLYLASFRNVGGFHEDCTVAIGKKLVALLEPKWLRIGGYWYPRGGMPIDVFWQAGKLPAGVWVPDQGVAPYRGRG
jgi:hypothetical protein